MMFPSLEGHAETAGGLGDGLLGANGTRGRQLPLTSRTLFLLLLCCIPHALK